MHQQVETAYQQISALEGEQDWLEKQRFLLADMAIHLLQTSIEPGHVDLNKLKNNIYSILTISERFISDAGLKEAANQLLEAQQ